MLLHCMWLCRESLQVDMLNELHTPSHSTRHLIVDPFQHLSPNIGLKRRLGASSTVTQAYQLGALGTITGRVTTNGRYGASNDPGSLLTAQQRLPARLWGHTDWTSSSGRQVSARTVRAVRGCVKTVSK